VVLPWAPVFLCPYHLGFALRMPRFREAKTGP
jgi:hypothetical protein